MSNNDILELMETNCAFILNIRKKTVESSRAQNGERGLGNLILRDRERKENNA